jgi:hypothetical protein
LMTFDYEIFLNNSGTLDSCILRPVDKLIDYSIKNGAVGTYFIDVLYYMRLAENKETTQEARLLKDQLQRLIQAGNRVELHLHPQWLDAKRNGNAWEFPTLRYYRLHELPGQKITDLFVSGVELLESVAREVDSNYKVKAFRAGGWCIQPFEKLKEGFIKSGIVIDSTVMSGLRQSGDTHNYDFLSAPDLPVYRFTDDPTVGKDNGLFFEVPITSFRRSVANKIAGKVIKYLHKGDYEISGDGSGIPSDDSSLRRLFLTRVACTLDDVVPSQFADSIKRIDKTLVTVMSHPKLLSHSSLAALDTLIADGYSFITIDKAILIPDLV